MAWSSCRTEQLRRAGALALAVIAAGCSGLRWPGHELEPVPVLGGEALIVPPSPLERRTGSLWRANVSDNYLFTDDRARLPGDLLTIVISEDDTGTNEAKTATNNKSSVFENLTQFFGLPQEWASKDSDIDPSALIEAESERDWDGSGDTSRKARLKARMTAEVKAISATGNLWVQGEKLVTLNNEEQHVVLSGWVRPQDISAKNEVDSTRLASARIEYYGLGPLGRQQHAPWGIAILDWIWPF